MENDFLMTTLDDERQSNKTRAFLWQMCFLCGHFAIRAHKSSSDCMYCNGENIASLKKFVKIKMQYHIAAVLLKTRICIF